MAGVGLMLVARLLLVAFHATKSTPFVQWIYDHTAGLIASHSMFKVWNVKGHPVELNTAVAIIVYGIGMLIVVKVIDMLLTPRKKMLPV